MSVTKLRFGFVLVLKSNQSKFQHKAQLTNVTNKHMQNDFDNQTSLLTGHTTKVAVRQRATSQGPRASHHPHYHNHQHTVRSMCVGSG